MGYFVSKQLEALESLEFSSCHDKFCSQLLIDIKHFINVSSICALLLGIYSLGVYL